MNYSEKYKDFSWIKVKKFKDNKAFSFEKRLLLLQKHHEEETNFLIQEVRKLALELDSLK
jgi:hypothetical protein